MKPPDTPFGRFTAAKLLSAFSKASVCGHDDWVSAEILISDSFSVVVGLTDGAYSRDVRELVEDILRALPQMDDEVLREFLDEQRLSGFHPREYENDLIAIEILNPDTVEFAYFGTAVNTQWEIQFSRSETGWKRKR